MGSVVTVKQYDSMGFLKVEPFCLYAAFAPIDGDEAYIKVGISKSPFRRIYEVHCGSPEPVQVALWTHIGGARAARKVEYDIHKQLEPYKSRGEWMRMNLASAEQKELFHSACKAAVAKAIGKRLKWSRVTIDQIRGLVDVEGFALKRKLG